VNLHGAHGHNLNKPLGANDRTQAIAIAVRAGIMQLYAWRASRDLAAHRYHESGMQGIPSIGILICRNGRSMGSGARNLSRFFRSFRWLARVGLCCCAPTE